MRNARPKRSAEPHGVTQWRTFNVGFRGHQSPSASTCNSLTESHCARLEPVGDATHTNSCHVNCLRTRRCIRHDASIPRKREASPSPTQLGRSSRRCSWDERECVQEQTARRIVAPRTHQGLLQAKALAGASTIRTPAKLEVLVRPVSAALLAEGHWGSSAKKKRGGSCHPGTKHVARHEPGQVGSRCSSPRRWSAAAVGAEEVMERRLSRPTRRALFRSHRSPVSCCTRMPLSCAPNGWVRSGATVARIAR